MRKVILGGAAAAALAFVAMPAAAADWYAQVNVGSAVAGKADTVFTVSDGTDEAPLSRDFDLKAGLAVGAAAGVDFHNGLRVEGEALYTSNRVKQRTITVEDTDIDLPKIESRDMDFFLNAIYDIPVGQMFKPYVGAGVGYGSSTVDIDDEGQHDQGVVWQLKTGVPIPVNDTLTLDVGYRYIDQAKPTASADVDDFTVTAKMDPAVHVIAVGGRLKIGGGS